MKGPNDRRRGSSEPAGGDAAPKGGEHLTSIDALRRRVPAIIQRLNAEPAMALRAAANPIFALEELGYSFPDALKREIALRVRFDATTIARLESLANTVHELAGEEFDLDSADDLDRTLFTRLGLPRLTTSLQRVVIAEGTSATRQRAMQPGSSRERHPLEPPWHPPGGVATVDPLRELEGRHPIVAPLLEYRALQASQPPLAPRELYERIARGDVSMPTMTIRARLRRGAAEPPDA